MGSIPPFLLKTGDNPEGVDGAVFDEIKAPVLEDRPAYFKAFLDNFYNLDVLGGTRISEQAWSSPSKAGRTTSPGPTPTR